jgi:hypothetical protein
MATIEPCFFCPFNVASMPNGCQALLLSYFLCYFYAWRLRGLVFFHLLCVASMPNGCQAMLVLIFLCFFYTWRPPVLAYFVFFLLLLRRAATKSYFFHVYCDASMFGNRQMLFLLYLSCHFFT